MKRERNFEVMRTLAMFFIVIYHCLTHGVGGEYGFSVARPVTVMNLAFSDLLLVFCSISVNLYVMVSGYFLADLDFKLSRIVRTWLNTCFYSCTITLLIMALSVVPFSVVGLGKSLFPISTDAYWFVTQYIGLLILSPFLALLVRQLTYRQYVCFLIGGAFLCLSIIPDFPLAKRFHVAHGNSLWSFAYLFMIAGFIRHHLHKISMIRLWGLMALVVLLTLMCELYSGFHGNQVCLYWFDYNGIPFVLSVQMFVLVKQMKIAQSTFWNMLVQAAPYTFGVYLIHDHLMVREWLWNTLSLPSQCEYWYYPFAIIGLCVLIFIASVLIDAVRKRLFSIFKIDNYVVKIDQWSLHPRF